MIKDGTSLDGEACIILKERLYDMYLSSDMKNMEGLEVKVIEAVDSIIAGFPTVHDGDILFIASSWVAVIRVVYESIEHLNHDDSVTLLAEHIAIFESAMQHKPAVTRKDSFCDTNQHATRSYLKVFLSHTAETLPTSVFIDFVKSGIRVLRSKRLEFLHRRRGGINEADYLDLHTYIVGLGPLFVLLLYIFRCRDLPDEPRALLNRMLQETRTASLLQLDLIGLQNDINAMETFNYVLLQGNEPGSPVLELRRTKAITIHNDAVGSVIDCWNRIRAGDNLDVKACAEALLHLIEQRYRWCGKMTVGRGYAKNG